MYKLNSILLWKKYKFDFFTRVSCLRASFLKHGVLRYNDNLFEKITFSFWGKKNIVLGFYRLVNTVVLSDADKNTVYKIKKLKVSKKNVYIPVQTYIYILK